MGRHTRSYLVNGIIAAAAALSSSSKRAQRS